MKILVLLAESAIYIEYIKEETKSSQKVIKNMTYQKLMGCKLQSIITFFFALSHFYNVFTHMNSR